MYTQAEQPDWPGPAIDQETPAILESPSNSAH
jgi:hypothetical protein